MRVPPKKMLLLRRLRRETQYQTTRDQAEEMGWASARAREGLPSVASTGSRQKE